MAKQSLEFRHGLRELFTNQAFIAVGAATLLGVIANFALFSMDSVFTQPERMLSSVLSVFALMRLLVDAWFGFTGRDLAMFFGAALLLTLVKH
jgi:hypothetical protein